MEIRERQSIFRLWKESFSVTNRAGTSLFVSFLSVEIVLGIGYFALIHFLKYSALLFLFLIGWNIVVTCCGWLLKNAWIRIIAAKAEKNNETVSEALTSSIVPTIYCLCYYFLFNLAVGAAGFVLMFIPILGPIIFTLGVIYLILRLLFAQIAIVLRNQGPISAFSYSWELTSGNMLHILGALFVGVVLPGLFVALVIGGFIVVIPLYFSNSFSLVNLSMPWMIVLAVMGGTFLFIFLNMLVFFVLLFLNLDYGYNRDTFTPAPQETLNEQPTQVFGPENNVLPPGVGPTVQVDDLPQVEVLQSSVHSETDSAELHQHLEQVYQPKPEDIVQYTEEDRMPTILFDDEMAKQLEQQHRQWEEKKARKPHNKDDGEISSIKMSK